MFDANVCCLVCGRCFRMDVRGNYLWCLEKQLGLESELDRLKQLTQIFTRLCPQDALEAVEMKQILDHKPVMTGFEEYGAIEKYLESDSPPADAEQLARLEAAMAKHTTHCHKATDVVRQMISTLLSKEWPWYTLRSCVYAELFKMDCLETDFLGSSVAASKELRSLQVKFWNLEEKIGALRRCVNMIGSDAAFCMFFDNLQLYGSTLVPYNRDLLELCRMKNVYQVDMCRIDAATAYMRVARDDCLALMELHTLVRDFFKGDEGMNDHFRRVLDYKLPKLPENVNLKEVCCNCLLREIKKQHAVYKTALHILQASTRELCGIEYVWNKVCLTAKDRVMGVKKRTDANQILSLGCCKILQEHVQGLTFCNPFPKVKDGATLRLILQALQHLQEECLKVNQNKRPKLTA